MHETIECYNKTDLINALTVVSECINKSFTVRLGKTRYYFKPVDVERELRLHTNYVKKVNQIAAIDKRVKVRPYLSRNGMEEKIKLERLKRFKRLISRIRRLPAKFFNEE